MEKNSLMIRQSTVNDIEKFDKDRILHINFNQDQGKILYPNFIILIKLRELKVVSQLQQKVDSEYIILSL